MSALSESLREGHVKVLGEPGISLNNFLSPSLMRSISIPFII